MSEIDDVTDLVTMLFPGNGNQQHAAARILLALKAAGEPMSTLAHIDDWRRDTRPERREKDERLVGLLG